MFIKISLALMTSKTPSYLYQVTPVAPLRMTRRNQFPLLRNPGHSHACGIPRWLGRRSFHSHCQKLERVHSSPFGIAPHIAVSLSQRDRHHVGTNAGVDHRRHTQGALRRSDLDEVAKIDPEFGSGLWVNLDPTAPDRCGHRVRKLLEPGKRSAPAVKKGCRGIYRQVEGKFLFIPCKTRFSWFENFRASRPLVISDLGGVRFEDPPLAKKVYPRCFEVRTA